MGAHNAAFRNFNGFLWFSAGKAWKIPHFVGESKSQDQWSRDGAGERRYVTGRIAARCSQISCRMGPPRLAKLPEKSGLTMLYGRYSYS